MDAPPPYSHNVFWPRPGRRAPMHYDAHCRKCGYNLRGLTEQRCPECGQAFEPFDAGGGNVPWSQRFFIGSIDAYWRTLRLVMFDMRRFARQVWSVELPDESDARKFSRWTQIVAFAPLLILWVVSVKWLVPGERLMFYAIGGAALVGLWVRWMTRLMPRILRLQHLPLDRGQRAITLSHYTCSALAISVLHMPPLLASAAARRMNDATLLRAILVVWAVFVMFHLGLWFWNCASFARGAMNWEFSTTVIFAMVLGLIWTIVTLVLLVALPLAATWGIGLL